MRPHVKITAHPDCVVVNTPGTHLQRQPRKYRSLGPAVDRAAFLSWYMQTYLSTF